MIRLPQPPQMIGVPATPEQYAQKFIEIQTYLQNLVTSLEIQQNKKEFETDATNTTSEDEATAKAFFFDGNSTAEEADLSNLNASNLTSGTIPNARLPATLPALDGSNLTSLNASNLGSGTVPSARISGTYGNITGVGTLTNFTSQGINDDANATAITIDANENVGINNTNPDQYVTTSKVVAIQGTANQTGSASLHMNGNTDGSNYYNTQVFSIDGVGSAIEITRFTGTGANGFRAYFKIIATGHTGAVGNGINIKEIYYDGGVTSAVQISSYVANFAPVISYNTSTTNTIIISLSSSNGSSPFKGVMKVEAMIPLDFSNSTWTVS